jgi:hypothetical protein
MFTTHSARSLIYTPDTTTSFLRSAGSILNYMYASNTHTTSTTDGHSPCITRSNNKQRTNPNRDLLRSKKKAPTTMTMTTGYPGKKTTEEVSKEQASEPQKTQQ